MYSFFLFLSVMCHLTKNPVITFQACSKVNIRGLSNFTQCRTSHSSRTLKVDVDSLTSCNELQVHFVTEAVTAPFTCGSIFDGVEELDTNYAMVRAASLHDACGVQQAKMHVLQRACRKAVVTSNAQPRHLLFVAAKLTYN